jgi:L-seryl-tRNA(Ser) seleniumtransferase
MLAATMPSPHDPAAAGAADRSAYADLPRTDDLLAAAPDLVEVYGRADAKAALTAALDGARAGIAGGSPGSGRAGSWVADLVAAAAEQLGRTRRPGPRGVVNAAGVVVHTNLGRAPLSAAAVAAVVAAAGYCDLEHDLVAGTRGSRGAHVDALLAAATGAEAAMVVNNCAAALVLVLATLAGGRQVPVSRGHLVEIGGSFRLPDIMAASGARLLEVGTTNRTRAADYRAGGDVAALLTVHPSNFTVSGFAAQPSLAEVAAVARDREVPHVHDAGSGLLVDEPTGPLAGEGSLAGALAAGADLVLASGDKLLGGPQAGLVVGRADLVARLRTAPLARALRVDKLRLAALNATLREHLAGRRSTVLTALALDADGELAARSAAVAAALGGRLDRGTTVVGGGSAPGAGVPSPVVVLDGEARLAAPLRRHDPPVVGRVHDGAVVLDLRTVDPGDDAVVVAAVRWARGSPVAPPPT